MEDKLQEYTKVYQMLEDDESKDIYLSRLNYLISGSYQYIKNIVTAHLPNIPTLNGKTLADLRASMPEDREIVLYGAGVDASEYLRQWANDKRLVGFCSRTVEKQHNGYLGRPVMSPEELLSRRDLSVVISTTHAREEIMQILKDGGYPAELIFDPAAFFRTSDPGQYFSPAFITYENEEVFVDAGCCELNCAIDLKKYCGHVKKVYAFEPDPENYKRCQEKKTRMKLDEVVLLPYGTWSSPGTLCFEARSNGSSCVSEHGNYNISVMPIDDAVDPSDRITFIKMDVEGAELESLKGAKQTILRDKPKLAICIYHKTEDMVTIPLYIKSLVPEYKLYVRHHSNGSAETVLYAVMP